MRLSANTKEGRDQKRQSYFEFNKATVQEVKEADCVIGTFPSGNAFGLLIFDGTAGKPSTYCTFRTEERRAAYIDEHLTSRRKTLAWKDEQKAKNKGNLTGAAATAKAIRAKLKEVFPEVKFSVTSSNFAGGNSVDINWTDGPVTSLVERITDQYQYGRFDSMTDCAYSVSIDEEKLGCSGAKFVHCQREQSEARKQELEFHCFEKSGQSIEEFLGYGRGSWAYENQYPETWEQRYQDMKAANEAEDADVYARQEEERRQQFEAEEKQRKLDAKIVNFADFRKKKEVAQSEEKAVNDMRQRFLNMLPNLSAPTIMRLRESITTGNPEDFYAAIAAAELEAALRGKV
jgi:hypothetical protein